MRPAAPIRLCLLLALALTAAAADFGALKPQGYVSDFARVLSPQARAALNDYCGRVEQATGAQIALVTLPSLDGQPVEDVAELIYRRWGIGSKGKDEGVLVLLAIRDRRSRIEVGYGLEPVIPDGFAGGVLRAMRDALRAGDYASALGEAARTIGEAVAREKNVDIGAAPIARRRAPAPQDDAPWQPFVVAITVLAFLLLTGGRGGRGGRGGGPINLLLAMMLGNAIGRAGGRGGGGFGGYDGWGGGGGGFGGFGGGMSGGGGASGSW
jgi:uncharacterized protein